MGGLWKPWSVGPPHTSGAPLPSHPPPTPTAAKFVDSQLRSGNKEWTDEEMERLLDRVLVLFRFIHGKSWSGVPL